VITALGIDVGMSGARAAVLDEAGALLGAGWAATRVRLTTERAEADPRDWLAGALAAGAAAVAEAGAAVDAIAVSALGPAPVLVTGEGEALGPALLFGLDRRAEAQRARLGVTHDHALPKLLWWAEHEPERVAGAAAALDATGYVVAGLCGALAMDAITAEAYTLAGVAPPVPLPVPCDPLARVGDLLPGPAEMLGLPSGTPVIAGTLDSYADVAGTGVPPGGGCLLLGSTLIVYAVWPEAVAVPGLEVQHHPAPGVLVGGASVGGGATIAWLDDVVGAEAGDLHVLAPGAGGLLVLPYFAGERTPVNDPRASGAILGLTYATTPDELRRAFIDAVALSALDHADRLRAHGIDPASWRAAGGATRNQALLHACSDALGRPLEVMPHAGAAIGPASLALRAAGVDWQPQPERVVEPDPARTELLAGLLGHYRAAYAGLAPTMHELAEVG
jgi:xylulokinase